MLHVSDKLARLKTALDEKYKIESEIGRGGAAVVYLAFDQKHRRRVAVKVLRPEVANALGPERFLREIEIAAQLTHPHILPLYDSGEAESFLFYVMPYIEGDTLEDRMVKEGRLTVSESLRIAVQVSDALDYAHRHDVIHRDIKPGNVLFADGHAVISDFGFARALNRASSDLTPTGLAVGTPAYMSPEQASGSEELDGRTDLYSLGCMLYEMLVGEPPFTAKTAQAVLARHAGETPPSMRVVRPEIPEHVEVAVNRALAKAKEDRWQTGDEMARALREKVRV